MLDQFWPGPRKSKCPILFCNVVGKEGDHDTGIKAAGGKKIGIRSKSNKEEAEKVVRYNQLILNSMTATLKSFYMKYVYTYKISRLCKTIPVKL